MKWMQIETTNDNVSSSETWIRSKNKKKEQKADEQTTYYITV